MIGSQRERRVAAIEAAAAGAPPSQAVIENLAACVEAGTLPPAPRAGAAGPAVTAG